MARVCFLLCVLLAAAAVADEPKEANNVEGMDQRHFPVVHLPVGTLHVPANGNGPVVNVPQTNPASAIASTGANFVNNIANTLQNLRPTLPPNTQSVFRPWSLWGWFKRPSPAVAAQQAAYQELHTPGKPGVCPYVRRLAPAGPSGASLCGNLCFNDWNCPAKTKCCATECGYACLDAVFNAQHNLHTFDKYHY
ncbi:uncharacterized protein LOC132201916 [Neocloeon triangulifer]|uniref:uncharacterized protein LOC132201916 n=1 Tax=Neocloeon triangulifer TaxID=2078957 RepID=UPI00286F3DF1|nr:uncharacterized protein LOC132201916 [Neocloeon triangulifer]